MVDMRGSLTLITLVSITLITLITTSYAGSLYSLDDFYLISSGLTVTESTLFIYNKTLYRDMPYGQKVGVLKQTLDV